MEQKKYSFLQGEQPESPDSVFYEPEFKQKRLEIEKYSPYLKRLFSLEQDFLKTIFSEGYDKAFSGLIKSAFLNLYLVSNRQEIETGLRVLKRRAALLAAMADIEAKWSLIHTTRALSVLAETSLRIAVSFVLRQAAEKGEFALSDLAHPEKNSGFIVLAMGKLGARELNYSSDIDLIVLYDDEKTPYTGKRDKSSFFVKITREIIALMEDKTAQGYVFRTDLRLRPDPGSTPVALSTAAAVCYYESFAQNWERAAFIKARAIAGDKAAGNAFLKEIRPFVWRRTSDFYVLQQIHEIKRSFGARAQQNITLAGHNIKLGQGGIREIEFFTQLQQLLWGGRDAHLRQKGTLNGLKALEKAGWVSVESRRTLTEAYIFLRTLEHRLQMVADEQTQTLPKTKEELEKTAGFMGYKSYDIFAVDLIKHLETVQKAYDSLFASEEEKQEESLSFSGIEIPVETAGKLNEMGFKNLNFIADAVRGWLSGRYRSVRNDKARVLMADLLPFVFKALGRTENADTAFVRFDEFLKGLPAGVQLFSLFQSRPALLDLLAEIMGSSPRLSSELAHRPELFDAVLSPSFFQDFPDEKALSAEADAVLSQAEGVEEALDITRRFVREKRFQCGVQFLRGLIEAQNVGKCLADLVSAALSALCPLIRSDFENQYGVMPDSFFSFVLLGKAGSREMSFLSDLDILFIYDAPPESCSAGGRSSLGGSIYYARFAQRLINAVTANTREGLLWPVDMRLRPSGSAGPAAVSLSSFQKYYTDSAWTWEYMALTKARPVWGNIGKIEAAIQEQLLKPRDVAELLSDIREMRRKIGQEHQVKSVWDIKYGAGGMVDIEFSAQYLQLKYASAHPDILLRSTADVLRKAREKNLLSNETYLALSGAYDFWQKISVLFSICLEDGHFDIKTTSEEIQKKLCVLCGVQDIQAAEQMIRAKASDSEKSRLF